MTSDPQVEIFKQNWATYQKLISHNYMFHRQRNEQADMIIRAVSKKDKINILDLGCGDAYWVKSLSSQDSIKSYRGIDLSPAALEIAQLNLTQFDFDTKLLTGRMEDLIRLDERRFQLVYSAYAIHHLQDEVKLELLTDIYNRSDDGGLCILIDVYRKPGQSREDYLHEYITWIQESWTALEPKELSLIISHIQQYDFPAQIDNVRSWTETIGFKPEQAETLDDYHHMLILSK